jgi:hypothetical protein
MTILSFFEGRISNGKAMREFFGFRQEQRRQQIPAG